MIGIRIAISTFMLILITLAGLGWRWTSAHQPPAQARASHVVLGLIAVAGVIALVTVWRPDPSKRGRRPIGGR
jgi:uncharacterized membrane protein